MADSFKKMDHPTGDLFDAEGNGHDPVTKMVSGDTPIPEETDDTHCEALLHEMVEDNLLELDLTDNARKVLERRYLKKNEYGEVTETPVQMFRRVARFVAAADRLFDPSADVQKIENEFFSIMTNLEFMPNSPTLMNAGRDLGQLSACFVLPIEDSMNSIFEAVKNTALIHKSGGGTGFSFSRIRPQNDIVRSTHGIASGPISFLQVFDSATETVKQGGTRRGANMAILRIDHPDIMDFITCKEDNDTLNNFNISVAITDTFWKALEKSENYDLINPHSKKKTGTLNAREVFNKIVHHAWENGDPGIVFIDRINRDNKTPQLGEIESTNPCGEQPLLPYESCNLGSINLAKMVNHKKNRFEIDYNRLRRVVHTSVHFLDNVIDVNKYPLDLIEERTKATRKIGLGVMGFADLLMRLDIPYNSDEAIEIAKKVMGFINSEAKKKSQEMALNRGGFPAFEDSVYAQNREPLIRNTTRTTIAPTGSISIIAGCSSGIEPLFALSFTRTVMDDDKLPEIHPLFCQKLKDENLYSEELLKKIAVKGCTDGIKEIPNHIKKVFVTSHEISPEWHIRMQAAFQQHTDNAVSKTVNFPNEATVEDIDKVYRLAYQLGCKGITIYRDGSREKQVLTKGMQKKESKQATPVVQGRPRILSGFTSKLNTGQGSLYVTINTNENNQPVEVFANIGKSGGDTSALAEAIGRLISIALQNNVSLEEISHTLKGITGSRPVWNDGILVKSVPDGIGQILLDFFGPKNETTMSKPESKTIPAETANQQLQEITGPECPECGSVMETGGGCSLCRACGYSHCG